jgi:trimethylamine--corrinoid protein Co-methyltransferase
MMIYDQNIPNAPRRSGGGEARRTLRAAPLARDLRPVRAGLEGGQFKPLDAEAVKSIGVTVYQILEEIGLSQAPESGIKYMTDAGAVLGDDGRVRFPRALVEDTLSKCAHHITLYGQNSKHDLL